jgi:enoyl-CoA hydratase/carnithine racemase
MRGEAESRGAVMDYEFISEERRGEHDGIVWLTLNRPDRLNALTFPMLAEMRDLFERVHVDRSARCLVITGAGRGFCSGMDHRGAARDDDDASPAASDRPDPEGERLNFRNETLTFTALRRLDIPVIAGINGPCVGAGFDMVCLCDLAVASTSAVYQVAYVKRGLYPDLGGFWAIPKIIGWRKAMELMMTGRMMDAEEGQAVGVSNYLVPPEQFDDRLMQFALEVEAGPPIGQKVGKIMAYRTANLDYESALELSGAVLPLVTLSEDRVEGVRSFTEKREPRFTGR